MLKILEILKKPIAYGIIIILIVTLGIGLSKFKIYKEASNNANYEKTLLNYRTPYVGDNSKVGNIIQKLNVPNGVTQKGIELKTQAQPYEIIINYDVASDSQVINNGQLDALQFYKNSAVIFSLVENVDNVLVNLNFNESKFHLRFTRQGVNDCFRIDVRYFARDEIVFKDFLTRVGKLKLESKVALEQDNINTFNIYKADDQLTYLYKAGSYFIEKERLTEELPTIIKNEYAIDIKKISISGSTMIVDMGKDMEIELDRGSANAAYKLSVLYKSILERESIKSVKVLIDGKEGVEANHFSFKDTVSLESDGRTAVEKYFKLVPDYITPKAYDYDKTDLNQVIRYEILKKNANGYSKGETQTEGHKILRVDKEEGHTLVYMVESYGEFGFENGIFTKISGSGAIPTVMTFAKNGKGEYILESYKIPQDGSGYGPSIKKMFPSDLQRDAIDAHKYYNELKIQEETFASVYLKIIGRNAAIKADHVEKVLANINVAVSNKLLMMYGEYPYWIGTLERLENRERYVYVKEFVDKGNGDGTVSFIKKKYNGDIVESTVIEVSNGQMTYLKGTPRELDYSKKY